MIKVIIHSNYSPYAGSEYCAALGSYPSLEDAQGDATDYAYDRWESWEEDEDFEDEGPNYWIEIYNPEIHDMLRPGGGSFEEDF
jgi:hypothetical protein